MSWFNVEKPPEKWSASYFKLFVERLRTAINYLDSENFPDGISGLLLKDKSVSLKSKIYGWGGLVFYQDFFAVHPGISVAVTTSTSFGSPVLWSATWKTYAKVFVEFTAYANNASYPGTVEVHGTGGAIFSQAITSTVATRYEFEITNVAPATDMTLIFKALVNNTTYPLTILSARIILKTSESV